MLLGILHHTGVNVCIEGLEEISEYQDIYHKSLYSLEISQYYSQAIQCSPETDRGVECFM